MGCSTSAERFTQAITSGDLATVESLIGGDNRRSPYETISCVAYCGQTETLRFVLEWFESHGEPMSDCIHTLDDKTFWNACVGGHTETARFLFEWCESHSTPFGRPALVSAIHAVIHVGQTETLQALLQWSEPHWRTRPLKIVGRASEWAVHNNHIGTLRFISSWFMSHDTHVRAQMDTTEAFRSAWNKSNTLVARFLVQCSAVSPLARTAFFFFRPARFFTSVCVALRLSTIFHRVLFHYETTRLRRQVHRRMFSVEPPHHFILSSGQASCE